MAGSLARARVKEERQASARAQRRIDNDRQEERKQVRASEVEHKKFSVQEQKEDHRTMLKIQEAYEAERKRGLREEFDRAQGYKYQSAREDAQQKHADAEAFANRFELSRKEAAAALVCSLALSLSLSLSLPLSVCLSQLNPSVPIPIGW
jgi:hypothetical protein